MSFSLLHLFMAQHPSLIIIIIIIMMKKGKGQNVTSYDKLSTNVTRSYTVSECDKMALPNLSLPSWKVVALRLGEVLELGVRSPNVSVLLVSFVPFCRTR